MFVLIVDYCLCGVGSTCREKNLEKFGSTKDDYIFIRVELDSSKIEFEKFGSTEDYCSYGVGLVEKKI